MSYLSFEIIFNQNYAVKKIYCQLFNRKYNTNLDEISAHENFFGEETPMNLEINKGAFAFYKTLKGSIVKFSLHFVLIFSVFLQNFYR